MMHRKISVMIAMTDFLERHDQMIV